MKLGICPFCGNVWALKPKSENLRRRHCPSCRRTFEI